MLTSHRNKLSILELLVRLNTFSLFDFSENTLYQYLFSLSADKDEANSQRKALQLRQPQHLIPADYLKNQTTAASLKTSFVNYMKQVLVFLDHSNANYENDLEDVFEIYKELSLIQQTPAQRRNRNYTQLTIAELSLRLPNFPWSQFLFNVFKDFENVNVNSSEPIQVYDWPYFQKMDRLFKQFKKRESFKNYLIYLLFEYSWSQLLPEKYAQARLVWSKQFNGIDGISKRKKTCVKLINNYIPFAIGKVYVENFFDETSRQKVFICTNIISPATLY